VDAYEEIAANRMHKIRGQVLQNREFLVGLADIYHQVKAAYKKKVAEEEVLILKTKKGKVARVFVSANTGLYGDIVQRTFYLLKDDLTYYASNSEVIIIGQLGWTIFKQSGLKIPFAYFDFPDERVDSREIKELAGFLSAYESVVVYHGVFKNLLMQVPQASNISGDELLPVPLEIEPRKEIYEPTLQKVMVFFETEIFSSLLTQTVYESQLAKLSSRIVSLDQANQNIAQAKRVAVWEAMKARHQLLGRKQQEMLIGRQSWGQNG
jgi:F0F1-type ATP synthase gamma subunit